MTTALHNYPEVGELPGSLARSNNDQLNFNRLGARVSSNPQVMVNAPLRSTGREAIRVAEWPVEFDVMANTITGVLQVRSI